MLNKSRNPQENMAIRQKADSLRNELMKGADFAEMARQYSDDRSAQINGGNIGYVTSLLYPYKF